MRIALVVLAIPINILCYSQSITPNLSARSAALGNTHAVLQEVFSVAGNTAALSKQEQTQLGVGYEINPQWQGANKGIVCLAIPFQKGVGQFSVLRFGDALYNESLATLGYAHSINQSSIGISTSVMQYRAEGFGNKHTVNFNFSGVHQFGETISVGAYVQNILKKEINQAFREKLPTRMAIGIAWQAAKAVSLYGELLKDLDYAAQVRLGVEYKANEKFFIRSGLQPKPGISSGGFGFIYKKITVDTAIQYFWTNNHFRQQTTLSYSVSKK